MTAYQEIITTDKFTGFKQYVHDNRNTIGHCPVCNANIKDRKVALYRGLINALYRAYVWCGRNSRHEFTMDDIKSTLTKSDYARFGDLIRFGGIVYRPEEGKGTYGINMKRAKAFFLGQYEIPVQITVDQITGETVAATYVSIAEFPEITKLLNEEGLYDHERTLVFPVESPLQYKRKLPTVAQYEQR